MLHQDKHNDKITSAIDKMSDTMATLNTVHTEMNHLSEKITSCEDGLSSLGKDIKDMNNKVISNSIQAEEYKHIKKIFVGFIVVAILGGGYMTKTTIDNSSMQATAINEVVEAIKNSVNKGK